MRLLLTYFIRLAQIEPNASVKSFLVSKDKGKDMCFSGCLFTKIVALRVYFYAYIEK